MRVEASAPDMAVKTSRERASSDRRREAIEAAIEVLAQRGARGLTHREIDRHLQWPLGSTSNYLSRRSDIFIAIAARIMELDLEDLAIFDSDLARPGGISAELLVERTVQLLARTMRPAQRSRALARAEILFETRRNEEVRNATQDQMAVANAMFSRIFQQLGSKDPEAAARFFAVLMSSAHVGMSVTDQVPNKYQLFALVQSWVAISIDQGRIESANRKPHADAQHKSADPQWNERNQRTKVI